MPELSQTTQTALLIATAILAGTILVTDVAILFAWLVSVSREGSGKEPIFARRWSLADVCVGGQIIVGLTLIASFVLIVLRAQADPRGFEGAMGDTQSAMVSLIIPATILQNVFTALVVFAYVRLRYRVRIGDFFIGRAPMRGLLIGTMVAIPLFLISAGSTVLIEPMQKALGHSAAGRVFSEIGDMMNAARYVIEMIKTPTGFFWTLLTIGVIGPIGEEIFFRGFLFNAAKQRFGLTAGLILSSLVFASIHLQVVNLIPIVLMSIVMAYAYHRSGTLLAPIAIHIINNTATVVLAYYAPNLVK